METKSFLKICSNCESFDEKNNTCDIRFIIHKDKSRSQMPRKPNQRGCEVFLNKNN